MAARKAKLSPAATKRLRRGLLKMHNRMFGKKKAGGRGTRATSRGGSSGG
jgi:hypothetical protein